jgi:4-hydroxy-3-polyprenylbenzoate decarboxylase
MRSWRDAREWIAAVDALGELRRVGGASWQADIGELTQLLDQTEGAPCVLFDDIPGYPAGFRVLVNANGTPRRQAVTLGVPPAEADHAGLLAFWRRTLAELRPVAPRMVPDGPVLEHTIRGGDLDLAMFPAPVWHAGDGGRYLGTATLDILRDPDEGWVNVGTYRNQVLGRDRLGLFISRGHHGRALLERWHARGSRCPIVVVPGADPLLFMASCAEGIAYGTSELAWAGGVVGEPIDVVTAPVTGLPIPAAAEIAIEGWVAPDDLEVEGPYGEWHGYYSRAAAPAPVIRVEAIHHRSDPILLGCPQGKPPHEDNRFLAYLKSALIEQQLQAAGVPGVRAVWCPPEAGNRMMVVVAITPAYPGHATQAGLVAGQVGAAAYGGRFVVVVDDDIDVFDLDDVLWAMFTRYDPARDTTIVERAWSSSLDTAVWPARDGLSSRIVIDATRPWEARDAYPEPILTREALAAARARWSHLFAQEAP